MSVGSWWRDELRILKIGGSVLTHKDTGEKRVRDDVLDRIAREVAPRAHGLILVHGAGSFGHPEAVEYGLLERFDMEGVMRTHEVVCTLNRHVVEALVGVGVPAVGISPMGCAMANNGRLVSLELGPVRRMVELGLVPVLHGDVVMDIGRGASVVSGDQLVAYAARELGVRYVGMASREHGILDPHGNTVPAITDENLDEVREYLSPPLGADITGGMAGKLDELLELAGHGTQSWMFSALKSGAIAAFLEGRPTGTLVALRNVKL